jgi:TolB-like protein
MTSQARTGRSGQLAAAAIVAFGLAVVGAFVVFGRWSGPSALRSVAILPLESVDPSSAALGAGISDSIRDRVGRAGALTVVTEKKAADAVLSGTVLPGGGRIRVSVRLVRSRDGRQIWADTVDVPESDLARVEENVAAAVVTRLRPRGRALTGS